MNLQGNPSADRPKSDQYIEDDKWVKAIKAGDKRTFRKMFETYYDPLLQFAFRYSGSRAVAEGFIQDVFLWIWENRKKWKVEGQLKTYLYRAVKYKAIDYWRHERTKEEYMKQFSEEQASYEDPELFNESESEFIVMTQQTIEELPDRARMVYKLSRQEGLTYQEIADILEISPKTVETHMSRALDFLRKRLSKYVPVMFGLGSYILS